MMPDQLINQINTVAAKKGSYYDVNPNFGTKNKVDNDHYTDTIKQTQESKLSSSFSQIKDNNSSDKSPFHIVVAPSPCMAFGSCEKLAPETFVVEKDIMFNPTYLRQIG